MRRTHHGGIDTCSRVEGGVDGVMVRMNPGSDHEISPMRALSFDRLHQFAIFQKTIEQVQRPPSDSVRDLAKFHHVNAPFAALDQRDERLRLSQRARQFNLRDPGIATRLGKQPGKLARVVSEERLCQVRASDPPIPLRSLL